MKNILAILILGTAIIPAQASAAKKVYSPYVSEGKWSIENYGSYQIDDDESLDDYMKMKTAIGYGVTDYLKLELEAVSKNPSASGKNLEFNAWEPVAKWQLTDKDEYFFDVGLYTALEIHADEDEHDKWEAKLLLAKKHDSWSHYTNFAFDKKYEGTDKDLEFELAHNTAYKFDDQWKIAAEAFLDFKDMNDANSWDEQDHRAGGELTYYVPNTALEVKAGYLAGLSNAAPQHTVKWFIEYKF